MTVPSAPIPLQKAIRKVMIPLVRHPNISTGVAAIIKKTAGIRAGSII